MRIVNEVKDAVSTQACELRNHPSIPHVHVGRELWKLGAYDMHPYYVLEGVICDWYHVPSRMVVILSLKDNEPQVDLTRWAQQHKLRLLVFGQDDCMNKTAEIAKKILRLMVNYAKMRRL